MLKPNFRNNVNLGAESERPFNAYGRVTDIIFSILARLIAAYNLRVEIVSVTKIKDALNTKTAEIKGVTNRLCLVDVTFFLSILHNERNFSMLKVRRIRAPREKQAQKSKSRSGP